MSTPMTAGQQARWDQGRCIGCEFYLDPADRLWPDGSPHTRPWCEPCWKAELERDAEESQWCDCSDRRYCPGPHRGAA